MRHYQVSLQDFNKIRTECIYDAGNTTIRPDKIKVIQKIGDEELEIIIPNPNSPRIKP